MVSAADSFTYMEAMESPQWDHQNRAMEEQSTWILFYNFFSALHSLQAGQLHFKLIGSNLIY